MMSEVELVERLLSEVRRLKGEDLYKTLRGRISCLEAENEKLREILKTGERVRYDVDLSKMKKTDMGEGVTLYVDENNKGFE